MTNYKNNYYTMRGMRITLCGILNGLIKLDVIDYNSCPTPQPATWFLYYNTNYGNCGGDAFARRLDANSDYFKWNFLDPNGQKNF